MLYPMQGEHANQVGSFIGGGNQEYPEKTTDLSQVTDKLYHKTLHRQLKDIQQQTKHYTDN